MQLFVTWSQLEFPRCLNLIDPITLKAISGKHEIKTKKMKSQKPTMI